MAAKILKGQKPADTPVEIFSQGKSVINKKVADELGITCLLYTSRAFLFYFASFFVTSSSKNAKIETD